MKSETWDPLGLRMGLIRLDPSDLMSPDTVHYSLSTANEETFQAFEALTNVAADLHLEMPGLLTTIRQALERSVRPGHLTQAETDFLNTTEEFANLNDDDFKSYQAGVAATSANDYATSAPTDVVAGWLNVSASAVRHRKKAGLLLSITAAGAQRFPVWQFVTGPSGSPRPMPHLPQVLAAFRNTDIHPASIAGFMQNAQPDLSRDGHPQTPRDWLSSGGNLETVLDLIVAADTGW